MLMKCRRQGGEQLINFLHFPCLLNRVFAPQTFTIPQNKTTRYQTDDNMPSWHQCNFIKYTIKFL